MSSYHKNIAIKSNPKLWNQIKNKWIRGSKGGSPGKVSARKMQLAVKEYKKRGGKYRGGSKKHTSLSKWTREKWDYISPRKGSRKYGRYLPLSVRKQLTTKEKSIENRLKGTKYGKRIPYSVSVAKKVSLRKS